MQIKDLDIFKVDITQLSDDELEQYIKDISVLKFKSTPTEEPKITTKVKTKAKTKTNKDKRLEDLLSSLNEKELAAMIQILNGGNK